MLIWKRRCATVAFGVIFITDWRFTRSSCRRSASAAKTSRCWRCTSLRLKKRSNKNITGISKKAMAWLRRYDWPGNVRELENCIERAVIIAQGRMIDMEDLPAAVRGAETNKTIEIEVGTSIDEVEKRMILQTLAYTRGDRSRAAQILGIGRKTLYRKLQLYHHQETPD